MHYPKYFQDFFQQQIQQSYYLVLMQKYHNLKQQNIILPKEDDVFRAFDYFDVKQTKVVIFGQDPYYTLNTANGLAFATNLNQHIPKSLQNIFQEIVLEYGKVHTDQTLISWAKQGVLLLNTALTVTYNQPNSHQNSGWKQFVINLITYLNKNVHHVVYLLWGNNAKSFAPYIDATNNLILTSAHPSPLSCRNFFHNQHFKLCNQYLKQHDKNEIIW